MRRAPTLPLTLYTLGYHSYAMNREKFIVPPLCEVPAGPFLMGSDLAHDVHARENEMPQHTVVLLAFEIAQFPVTVAEYAYAIKAHIVPEPFDWNRQLTQPMRPIVNIAWRHALAYAEWLATITEEPWFLPTEAQWEKAARGTDGRIYPWGDTWTPERASFPYSPIGQHPTGASPYGAHDMAGNIEQWVTSYTMPYPYDPTDGREDLTVHEDNTDFKGSLSGIWAVRGSRGGSGDIPSARAVWERAAERGGHYPSINYENEYGFRLLRGSTVS